MRLVWSALAVEELRALRAYSVVHWGQDVALAYLADIRAAAKRVAVQPHRARRLDDTFGIVRIRSHYLIVRADATADRLIVARVLHTAMDLERHLPPG